MTHLDVENLASDYLEGLLDANQRSAVDAHVAECAECRELLADVRHAMELCHGAETVEPKPWLISKILLATTGERKPTWSERIAEFIRPIWQPRVAYPIAMTVFTLSVIVNAAGLNLRSLRLDDLDPRTWVDRADRQGHLLFARAEKFYYDLRVVVEIESRVRQLGGQSPVRQAEPSKPAAPDDGSSKGTPASQTVASRGGIWAVAAKIDQALPIARNHTSFSGPGRSVIP
jgi:anti-sigma factor RsiW